MNFPEYTRSEQWVDGVLQSVAAAAALIGAGVLLGYAVPTQDALAITSAALYGVGLVALFGISTAYHLASGPRWKDAIRRADHAAIFFMIAGTYTPVALIGIGGTVGIVLTAAVWTLAVAGMLFKVAWPRRFELGSVFLYVALGALGLPAVGAMVAALPATELALLGVGGLLYVVGVGFHLWESLPQQNAVWHALVLAAAACHYVVVFKLTVGA